MRVRAAGMNTAICRAMGMRVLGVAAALFVCALAQAAPPDMSGYWKVDRYIEALRTLDGKEPPLKPEAKKLYEQREAEKRAGKLDFDPTAKCINPGVPRVMFLPYAMEFLQEPDQLTMLFAWNRLHRQVDLTGKALMPAYGTHMGTSGGRWEGDTLVVDTINLEDDSLLDASGLPGSDMLHVVERYTLHSNGKQLRDVITIEDASNYTHPWQTQVTYHRLPDSHRIFEDVCLDRVQRGEPAIRSSR
jgi:hypothetical protein